jgi:multidrug efflux pump subunit AcrA (membrane-fusion protein)
VQRHHAGVIAGIGILIAAGAIGGYFRYRAAHGSTAAPPAVRIAASAPNEIAFTGRIQAKSTVDIAIPADGMFDTWYVDVGQEVYKDQLLAKIRNPKFDEAQRAAQSELDKAQGRVATLTSDQLAARLEASRAEAGLTRANSEVDRLQKIYEKQRGLWAAGATARLTWEKAQKDYADAKADAERQDTIAKSAMQRDAAMTAELEAANRTVANATAAIDRAREAGGAAEIHAPADGIVIVRRDLQGQAVDTSMKDAMKIGTDLTQLQVVYQDPATPPSVDVRIQKGQAATVKIGDQEIAGTVSDVTARSVTVDFTIPEPAKQLDIPVQVKIKF